MQPRLIDLLKNPDMIAVNQQYAGYAGDRVWEGPVGREMWAKPLENASVAVALFNRDGYVHLLVELTCQGSRRRRSQPRCCAFSLLWEGGVVAELWRSCGCVSGVGGVLVLPPHVMVPAICRFACTNETKFNPWHRDVKCGNGGSTCAVNETIDAPCTDDPKLSVGAQPIALDYRKLPSAWFGGAVTGTAAEAMACDVFDVYATPGEGKHLGRFKSGEHAPTVPPHGVILLRLSNCK